MAIYCEVVRVGIVVYIGRAVYSNIPFQSGPIWSSENLRSECVHGCLQTLLRAAIRSAAAEIKPLCIPGDRPSNSLRLGACAVEPQQLGPCSSNLLRRGGCAVKPLQWLQLLVLFLASLVRPPRRLMVELIEGSTRAPLGSYIYIYIYICIYTPY